MPRDRRSNCPISASLDIFGDRWTLLILRDLVFAGPRYYRQFQESPEGIATNILADRLKRLVAEGMVTKEKDPGDAKRVIYRLTEKGLDTLPILLEIIVWGTKHDPACATPPGFLERFQENPEQVIAGIRAKAMAR